MFVKNLERPYLVAGGFPTEEKWVFFTPLGEVEISGCNVALNILLPLCSGANKLEDVVLVMLEKFSKEEILELLNTLAEHFILTDANHIFYSFYAYSRNPLPFSTDISREDAQALINDKSHLPFVSGQTFKAKILESELVTLLEKRKTVRSFSGECLNEADVMGLMWSACGKQSNRENVETYFQNITYNIPSGGALYPVFNYLFLFEKCGKLVPGLYLWHKETSVLELRVAEQFIGILEEIVSGIERLDGCIGMVCSVANFERSAKKYGNKAYNLIYSEVGHIMQNAYLFCAEHNLGIVEIAGYCDLELAKVLGIDFPQEAPLVVAAFGKEEKDENLKSRS